jgi:hypothetical protein
MKPQHFLFMRYHGIDIFNKWRLAYKWQQDCVMYEGVSKRFRTESIKNKQQQ